jgi:small subunit ribosomal protein S2
MSIDFSKLEDKAPEIDLEELLEAGCHFGHQKNRWHPKMASYIYAEKDGVHIFDLVKTAEQLRKAYNYAYQLGKEGKSLIFVGTKKQARDIIKKAAEEAGAMYIYSRWLGGLLTNWEQLKKSITRMIFIEEGLKGDKFKGYTKFERVQLDKERTKKGRFFDGIKLLKTKPDCLFVVDAKKEDIAVTEASLTGVGVMALVDSNTNPSKVDLVIPANDDAVKSIQVIVNLVAKGYKEGRKAK